MTSIASAFHPLHPFSQPLGPKQFFELHCTVPEKDTSKVAAFRAECARFGIRVLEFINGPTGVSWHVMTSVKGTNHAQLAFRRQQIYRAAERAGLEIIRDKVEVPPSDMNDRVSGHEYFEMHIDVRAAGVGFIPYDTAVWNISSNILKPLVQGMRSFTLTARSYNCTLAEFLAKAEPSMQSFLHLAEHAGKPIVEKCVHDSNPQLDYDWVTAK